MRKKKKNDRVATSDLINRWLIILSAAHPSQAHCLMTERWAAPVHPFPTSPFQSPFSTLLLSSPGAGASITHTPGRSRVENRAAVNPRGLYHAPPTLQPGHPSSPQPRLGSTPPSDQPEDGTVQGSGYWFISLIHHISWDMWDLLYSVCPYDACRIWCKWQNSWAMNSEIKCSKICQDDRVR